MACPLHKNFQADMAAKPKLKSKPKWEKLRLHGDKTVVQGMREMEQ